jgi:hypothetical protein
LWVHRHGCVLQERVGLYGYILEYAAWLMNKPTVSFTDTTMGRPMFLR